MVNASNLQSVVGYAAVPADKLPHSHTPFPVPFPPTPVTKWRKARCRVSADVRIQGLGLSQGQGTGWRDPPRDVPDEREKLPCSPAS